MTTISRIALLPAAAAALLLTGCGAEKTGSLTTGTTASDTAAASTAEPSATTDPAPAPDPDGKFTHSCDMLLNSDFESSIAGWLVGDAELRNTGNVGIKLNVKAVWKQAGSNPIVKVKKVRLGYGHHRAVHFKLPVSTGQVDAYQSAPGYFNDNACSVNATITSTFGRRHG
ncbi:MAG TPA: hypothetical protein VFI18_09670 [Gaiellales bacterium]|nr:hypothetical protein [Gaiellales bacterium]